MSLYTENPSDAELITLGINAFAQRMFKAGAGIVRTYDPTTNTAMIQPAVKHAVPTEEGDRVYEDLPELPNVPVVFPRAGGFVCRMPVNPGDSVLLVYLDQSHAEWRESGQTSEPEDARRHSIGHVVAIPGFFPDSSPMAAADASEVAAGAMVLGKDGGDLQVLLGGTVDGIRLGKSASAPVALAPNIITVLTQILAWIKVVGPLITTASVATPITPTAAQTAYNTLVGVLSNLSTDGIASTNTKAEGGT